MNTPFVSLARASIALSVAIVAACTSEGVVTTPAGLDHAVAVRACAPTDGPAVTIYLAGQPIDTLEPAAPFVRVTVYQALEALAGGTWSLAGTGQGSATYASGAASDEAATSATLHVTAVGPDSTVAGTVDLVFPTAGHVTGGFQASWRSRSLLCG